MAAALSRAARLPERTTLEDALELEAYIGTPPARVSHAASVPRQTVGVIRGQALSF